MRTAAALLLLAAGWALAPAPVAAQGAADQRAAGIRAFSNLDMDAAAGLLRAATAPGIADPLPRPERVEALFYLGAAEIFRERTDSARAAFTRVLELDPTYRPNRLLFPPTVTNVFEDVRRTLRAVAVRLPDTAVFDPRDAALGIRLYASVHHDLRVELWRADGGLLRSIYSGPVGDSLEIAWDGTGRNEALVASGRYFLVAISPGPDEGVRLVQVPLQVTVAGQDTLPYPPPPSASDLLPEQRGSFEPASYLFGGVLLGAAAAALPTLLANEFDGSPARFAVGGALSIGGLIGFLTNRPGSPIAANVRANDRVRAEWRAAVDSVQAENARRTPRVRVVPGEPIIIRRGP